MFCCVAVISNTFLCSTFFFCPSRSVIHFDQCSGKQILWPVSTDLLLYGFWLALVGGVSLGSLEEPVTSCWICVAKAVLCFVSRSQLLVNGPYLPASYSYRSFWVLVTPYLPPLGLVMIIASWCCYLGSIPPSLAAFLKSCLCFWRWFLH